jgi:DegV family protein with EDD domain
MGKPTLITDGASDLSRDIIEEYGITIIPYRIFFGDEEYKCWHHGNASISIEEIRTKLVNCPDEKFPRTSIPTLKEYHAAFDEALEKSETIIAIFLSSKMSGAIQTANLVRNNGYRENDITIFDSLSVMSGSGIQVLEAAKLVKQNYSKEEIISRLEEINPKVRSLFVMDDLNYLYRNGRIGRAKKFMATTFNMTPTVYLKEGIIHPLKAFKGYSKLKDGLKAYCEKIMLECETNEIFLTHINHHELAQELYATLQEANPNGINIHFRDAAPIMGIHAGPKSLGISYIGDWDKSWVQ